jgi:L-alanine-DL-glutamate epimerase-like enolase superfamily enzyme
MELRVEPRRLRFRAPIATAGATYADRELDVVRVTDRDGVTGLGEAAPLEPFDGVSLDAVRAEVEGCRELLAGGGDASPAELRAACRRACSLPHAVAALDVALWDLEARRAGRPLAALLAPEPRAEVTVNAFVDATDREGASRVAGEAAAAGFRCVKVKVGTGDDAGRLAAVRAAVGPRVAIRIDANGAWSRDEAVAALRALAPVRIELCEEPTRGVAGIRAVRAALAGAVAVALDESAREPDALTAGGADAVCLRVGACGGMAGVQRDAATARSLGADVYVASTFDGPVGVAAGLHVAAALRVARPCGLATLGLFEDVEDPLPPRDGTIRVPESPGLGIAA